jgi:hypothetical protein
MKITRENLKNIVREAMVEENAYQEFFKKALEKTGKSIPQMSDEEKKAFFNKIDSAWKGKGEKKESVDMDIDEEAVVVSKRTPEGNIVSKLKEELTDAQKKLPPALQKAIAKKDGKDESINEAEIKWNAVDNAIVRYIKQNIKVLEKPIKARDEDGTKKMLKAFIGGLVNAQRSLKLESTNERMGSDKGAIESVNEAKTYTPKQVKQVLEKMVKQLKAKWKQTGGYENFGQRELDKFKKTFGYSPYGSSDERKISDLIDSFEDWAMDYSA